MLDQVWMQLRGRTVEARGPITFTALIPDDDAIELDEVDDAPRAGDVLSGYACIIDYVDSKGRASQRRVSFIRYERAKGADYIRAHCHERRAMRCFRLDRIAEVYDIQTGEVIGVDAAFGHVAPDRVESAPLGWGLAVRARADLTAGLNVLTFLARCDREWHPMEEDTIESFVTGWWLRRELRHEPPIEDILRHAERLRPDAETFFGALLRTHDCPALAAMLPDYIQLVIEADDRITSEEAFWAGKAAAYLS